MIRTFDLGRFVPDGITRKSLRWILPIFGIFTANLNQDAESGGPEEPPGFLSEAEWDPATQRGVLIHESQAQPGLTLIQPLTSRFAHLIGLDGEIVHTWEFDSAPGEWCYLLDDGSLLRAARVDKDPHFRGGGIGGKFQRLAPDSTVLWEYKLSDREVHSHHDLTPLPNGNLIVIAWTRKSAEQAIASGRDPKHVGDAGLWVGALFELEPKADGGTEVVWEWHAFDHMVQDFDPQKLGFSDLVDAPGRIDINGDHRKGAPESAEDRATREREKLDREALEALGYVPGIGSGADAEVETEEEREKRRKKLDRSGDFLHLNAVDYDPEHDLLVVSSPQFNEIWVIDHSTTSEEASGSVGGRFGRGGDLLYRWGNPSRYGQGEESDRVFGYQHDPKWLRGADGSLRLTVFNNRPAEAESEDEDSEVRASQVVELVLPFEAERGFLREPDQPFGPPEPVWSYRDEAGFFSAFISGAERLSNGNTLICSGAGGRVFEVTPEGRTVWNYRNVHGGDVDPPDHAGQAPPLALFRATRLVHDHPGIRAILVTQE